ncbi:radical SAM/SPASM domain-containing protein [Fluviispira vulneris]|uniref:radical SAM/SPASM domain-containing protein n=1 Tax=Fluviispira vulneris TaxID=2763012 RepID=UPI001644915B|nr:radical SAM protein [Fluviispira vulneris]
MKHIQEAKNQIEMLWAKGTNYSSDVVQNAKKSNRLLHLDMDLTGECKLKCFYCDRTPDRFNNIPNRIELTTDERINLINQAKELGAETVEFPGAGEPMIDPGFWSIIEHIKSIDMTSVVFTSGYHIDDKNIDRLYENNATIFLKYNHRNHDVQDRMVRVKGYGKKSENALHLLIERGFNRTIPTRMAIDMVVTPSYIDIEEVSDIFRWCRDNNIHSYISTLIPEGLADTKSKILEREKSSHLLKTLAEIDRKEYGLEYKISFPLAGGYRCRQVNVGLFVNLFGEVYDCNGLGRFLGHIKKNSLSEIWNSKFAKKVREPNQNGFCVLRERVWDGVESKGIERKLEEYYNFKLKYGSDEILEKGLDFTGHLGGINTFKNH